MSYFNQINWEQILCNENNDVSFSMDEYLSKIDSLLDTHAPVEKLSKKELKFFTKQGHIQRLFGHSSFYWQSGKM